MRSSIQGPGIQILEDKGRQKVEGTARELARRLIYRTGSPHHIVLEASSDGGDNNWVRHYPTYQCCRSFVSPPSLAAHSLKPKFKMNQALKLSQDTYRQVDDDTTKPPIWLRP